jgi:aldehyde dehydrogenase (NAD+)
VHDSVSTKLLALVQKYIKEFWDDGKNKRDMGKVINSFHLDRLTALLRNHGGSLIYGSDISLKPSIVLNPSLSSPLMCEEIFGPILPVLTFRDIKDAVTLINHQEKPLVVYYFGAHFGANFRYLQDHTSSGALISNETMFHLGNSDMPFGGVGMSGYGRYHGFEGFKAFSNCKSVMHKPPLNIFPYNQAYPPYTKTR